MSQQPQQRVDLITAIHVSDDDARHLDIQQTTAILEPDHGNGQSIPLADIAGVQDGQVVLKSADNNGHFSFLHPVKRFTILPEAHVEPRPFEHKYVIMRPRLLQYLEKGSLVDAEGHVVQPVREEDLLATRSHGEGNEEGDLRQHSQSHESLNRQRSWLSLFVDLLWVGIVSNISKRFSSAAFEEDGSWGLSFLEFSVMFLTAWKLWEYLAKFHNNFFRKDLLQSLFLMWIFVLALAFGNNAPYFLDPTRGNFVIYVYLVARGSFIWIECVYSIFIPEIRREAITTLIIALPTFGLWIGSFWVLWPAKGVVMLVSIVVESWAVIFMALPTSDFLLRGARRKAIDPEHYVERLQGFFIIILGEGVVDLIQGSPLGPGLSESAYYGIASLVIYYELYWLFFTGDHTKTFLHAVFRNRYTRLLFYALHIPLFASLLLLDASVSFLIETLELEPSDAVTYSQRQAQWTISGALTSLLVWLTIRTLLNRSFDDPGTLIINNRYLRLIPRMLVAIVSLCLPIIPSLQPGDYLGITMGMLQFIIFWEFIVGMEKGAMLFEPKKVE